MIHSKRLRSKFRLFAIGIFGLFAILSCKNETHPINFNSLNADISVNTKKRTGYDLADRMDHYDVPGVSIAVVRNGKIAWVEGYGISNANTGTVVDSGTLFQAASISKPFAALAVLQLLERDQLSLGADVNTYLQNWKIDDDELTSNEKITLERLLTHTAGVSVHGFPGYEQGKKLPTIEEVLNGTGNTNRVEVLTVPGSKWKYSGGGYSIVQKVIEDMGGIAFEEYLAQNVLRPIGMADSTFEQPLPATRSYKASAGHDGNGNTVPGLWNNYPEKAAAGLWTTPSDLARYCIAIHNILANKKEGILKKESVELMLTKHKGDWGLGPRLDKKGDSLVFGHSGGNLGFSSHFLAFPYQGNALVIMANGDTCMELINEIQRSIINAYQW